MNKNNVFAQHLNFCGFFSVYVFECFPIFLSTWPLLLGKCIAFKWIWKNPNSNLNIVYLISWQNSLIALSTQEWYWSQPIMTVQEHQKFNVFFFIFRWRLLIFSILNLYILSLRLYNVYYREIITIN